MLLQILFLLPSLTGRLSHIIISLVRVGLNFSCLLFQCHWSFMSYISLLMNIFLVDNGLLISWIEDIVANIYVGVYIL